MREKKDQHDNYQSNVNDRKDLEQRVSIGNKLDAVEEATLSKLTAAHESHKKHDGENYQSIVVKKRWSVAEDSMLARLVGESNSTKTK